MRHPLHPEIGMHRIRSEADIQRACRAIAANPRRERAIQMEIQDPELERRVVRETAIAKLHSED